ncbi:hypothetical protein JKF63_01643 [Porcisia hertigi]|uniref:Uncharacterized protein n=1 Tax=Porcisia hertigi TaxID=2761500 RepID=A0A836IB05_9TRYP|nr:hypothetical protein JKF63_01643 [Porcisia hertigi]
MWGAHMGMYARHAALVSVTILVLLSPHETVATVTASVTTDPVQPLLNVPFFAIDPALSMGSRLFISSDGGCTKNVTSACSVRNEVGGSSFGNGTCVFTVGSAALVVKLTDPESLVPAAYWCVGSPGSAQQVATLQMHKMKVTPPYVLAGEESVLTFGNAVPVGTAVGVYADILCNALIPGGGPFVMTKDRTVKITVEVPSRSFPICASVPTVSGLNTPTMLVSAVGCAVPYTVGPETGVRHQIVNVKLPKALSHMSLSTDQYCAERVQADQPVFLDERTPFRVTAPRGEYYFCGLLLNTNVYIPASNTFVVAEYDVVPHTLYVGEATDMSFALDAAPMQDALEAVLSTSDNCSDASSWQNTWSNPMRWTVKHLGFHYACVREKGSTAAVGYARVIGATELPNATLAPVLGMTMRVTLTHTNIASTRLTVPLSAPRKLHCCVSNPLDAKSAAQDEVVRYYRVETLLTKGTTVTLVRANASQPSSGATDMPIFYVAAALFAIGRATFPEAGDWDVCVHGTSTNNVPGRCITADGGATVAPRGVIAGAEGFIAVRGLPPKASVLVTSAAKCTGEEPVLAKGITSDEGTASLTLAPDNGSALLLCCNYTCTSAQPVQQLAGSVRSISMASGTCQLQLTAANVAAYAADTKFSVCAWNANNSVAQAALRTVTVTTKYVLRNVDRGAGMSSSAVVVIAVVCWVGGAALMTLVMFLVWRLRCVSEGNGSIQMNAETPTPRAPAGTEGARANQTRGNPLWKWCGRGYVDPRPRAQGGDIGGLAATNELRNTNPLSHKTVTTMDLEEQRDLQLNCMDSLPEVISQYHHFMEDSDFDYDTVSQIPCEGGPSGIAEDLETMLALLRTSVPSDGLDAKRQAELQVLVNRNATLLAVWHERPRTMKKDSIQLTASLLQEHEKRSRSTLEGHCRRAYYNLVVLFMSSLEYCNALSKKRSSESTDSTYSESELLSVGSWDVAPLVPLGYPLDSRMGTPMATTCPRSLGKKSVIHETQPTRRDSPHVPNRSTGPPSREAEMQPRPCLHNGLYRRRRFLEFPFVTNSRETLLGCSANTSEPVFVGGLTLVDLQAFHPEHRWLVGPPRTAGNADQPRGNADAFMAPDSTVPFVRRYLILLEQEFCAREDMLGEDAAFWSRLSCAKQSVCAPFSSFEEVVSVCDPDDTRSLHTSYHDNRNPSRLESDSDDDIVRHILALEEV